MSGESTAEEVVEATRVRAVHRITQHLNDKWFHKVIGNCKGVEDGGHDVLPEWDVVVGYDFVLASWSWNMVILDSFTL